MTINIQKTEINDLLIIQPKIFPDNRGYFFESFNENNFNKLTNLNLKFVQDNQSFSKKGVFRGFHSQKSPFEQDKLVRCISGKILDIAIDYRANSPTYLKYFKIELSGENNLQLFIPKGFLHGFIALEDSIINYKTTNYFNLECEDNYNPYSFGFEINLKNLTISEKDLNSQNIIL